MSNKYKALKHYVDARELRIGNCVKCEPLVIPRLQIEGTGKMRITGEGISMIEQKVLHVEPIELTEEILIKGGFRKVVDISKFFKIEFVQYINSKCWIYLLDDGFEIEIITGDERFNLHQTYKKEVHKLQNLYAEIFSEELNIEL